MAIDVFASSINAAMSAQAKLIVLVGPKGSGKTTIGRVLARAHGVHFLEVEQIAQRVLAASGSVVDEQYARRAFDEIVREVDALATEHPIIVLETTGASDQTPRFLDALRQRHHARFVRVQASLETCAERIGARDQSRQIQVSPALVREMHARTEALQLPWDMVLSNDPALSEEQIELAFVPIIRGSTPAPQHSLAEGGLECRTAKA